MSIEAEHPFRRSPDADPWRVRLKDRDGTILGAGIALAPDAVLTCAHVITRAAGFTGGDDAPDVTVTVEWVGQRGTPVTSARVDGWAPTLPGGGADIALLRTSTPSHDSGAELRRLLCPRNRPVHAFGFPPPHDHGISASATLAGRGGPEGEWLQLDPSQHGDRIRKGFSGAGVVDDRTGAVVGMVVTTFQDSETRLAWAIPVDVLQQHVPAIAEWVGPDVPCGGWEPVIGVIIIVYGNVVQASQVVDASGRSAAELSRVMSDPPATGSLGFAGLEHAERPEEVLDDVVAPLVRRGATVVLQFADESSPSAQLARQWQRNALQDRLEAFGEGVAELAEQELRAGRRRRRIRNRFTPQPELPDLPALAAELELPLAVLRSSVRDQDPARLARALRNYERRLVAGLNAVDRANEENDAAVMLHERLRGLLISYNAKTVQHGLMEDERLSELFRAARLALDADPCDLDAARGLVEAYVAEARTRT